jgi:hypothetical protein
MKAVPCSGPAFLKLNTMTKFFPAVFFAFLVSCGSDSPDTPVTSEKQAQLKVGEQLYKERCSVCHLSEFPSKELRKSMLAPPVFGIMTHVKEGFEHIEDLSDRKDQALAFIVDYALNPDSTKSLCEPHAIKRFGLMPTIKASTSEKELEYIAEYLYENFPPDTFDHEKNRRKHHPTKELH